MYPLRSLAHHNNTSFTKLVANNFVYDQINPLYHLYSRQYTKKKRMVNNICYSESTVISDLVYYHYLNNDHGSVALSPYNKGLGYLKFLGTSSIYSIKSEAKQKPFLGICLGMQLLFEKSYEFEECNGLSLIGGYVDKMNEPELVIPHMGWNKLEYNHNCKLYEGLSLQLSMYINIINLSIKFYIEINK